MTALPAAVFVGAVSYIVTDSSADWLFIEHETQSKGRYGYTHHLTATIYINPESPDDVKRLTLTHEILHAALETMAGSPAWDDLPDDKDAREEKVIRTLEHPLLSIIRDNPDLLTYLTTT